MTVRASTADIELPLAFRWTPGLVAGLVALCLINVGIGRWAVGGGNWSWFVTPSQVRVDPTATPSALAPVSVGGYDGQYFYRLALDPFPSTTGAHGIRLDHPAFRQQRIVYPLLARLLALGRPDHIAAALMTVNFFALVLSVWVFATIAEQLRLPTLCGIAPATIPGLLFAFGRDLAEPVSALWLSLAALGCVRGSAGLAAAGFLLAALTKESSIVTVLAIAGVGGLANWLCRPGARLPAIRTPQSLWLMAGATVLALGIWQASLFLVWGECAFLMDRRFLGLPTWGFLSNLWHATDRAGAVQFLKNVPFLLWHGWLALEVVRSFRTPAPLADGNERFSCYAFCAAWGLWSLLIACLSADVWREWWGFTRALADWSVLAMLLLMLRRRAPSVSFRRCTAVVTGLALVRLLWAV